MARTLVISNRKGGSGKSATAVNLAVELAARGQRVLLVDLDTQGHCAVGLGVQVPRAAPTVHGFLAGHNTLRAAVRDTGWFGVRLIAADNLSDHSVSGDRALLLRAALLGEGFLDEFDTVLLDTPPSLDGLLLNALCAADWVLVPFVPADELTDTLKELMGRIWEFWDEYGTNRERIGELIQRIGLPNFLDGIGLDPQPEMVSAPRDNPYIFVKADGGEK